jgi:hypothetical protein
MEGESEKSPSPFLIQKIKERDGIKMANNNGKYGEYLFK